MLLKPALLIAAFFLSTAEAADPLQIPSVIPRYQILSPYGADYVWGRESALGVVNRYILGKPERTIEELFSVEPPRDDSPWNQSNLWRFQTPEARRVLSQVVAANEAFERTLKEPELESVRSLCRVMTHRSTATGDTDLVLRLPVGRLSDLDLAPVQVKRYLFAEARLTARIPEWAKGDARSLPDLKEGSETKKRILKSLEEGLKHEVVFTFAAAEMQEGKRTIVARKVVEPNDYELGYLEFSPGKVHVHVGVNYYSNPTIVDVAGLDAPFVGYTSKGSARFETGEVVNRHGYFVKAEVTVSPKGKVEAKTYLWTRTGIAQSLRLASGKWAPRFHFVAQADDLSVAPLPERENLSESASCPRQMAGS